MRPSTLWFVPILVPLRGLLDAFACTGDAFPGIGDTFVGTGDGGADPRC